jgi:RNA polymerase subunit RPABC4/transcription elongation factor Spt4
MRQYRTGLSSYRRGVERDILHSGCEKCAEAFVAGAKFCPECGCAAKVCSKCGITLSNEVKFCPKCGTPAINTQSASNTFVNSDSSRSTNKEVLPSFSASSDDDDRPRGSNRRLIGGIVSLCCFLFWVFYFWGGGLERHVATKEISDYEFAKQHGASRAYLCIRASAVVEAYLQAHDEENYNDWKATATEACAAAGIPKNWN